MKMKKTKCYNEGGELEFETKQGPNKMIDDETRRRAMEMVNLDVDAEPRITKDAPKSTPKPAAKKSGFTGSETKGGASIMYRNQKRSAPAKSAPKKAVKYSVDNEDTTNIAAKKGGLMNSSASKRADGCAVRGKTKGRMV